MSDNQRILRTPEARYSTNAIKEEGFWIIRESLSDKKYHRQCLLIIPQKSYSINLANISPKAWREWGNLIQWSISHYQMKGGAVILRFGDPRISGNPLPYFYTTIHEPDGTGPVDAVFVGGVIDVPQVNPNIKVPAENRPDLGAANSARTKKYHDHLIKTIGQGKCPFCNLEYLKRECIKEGRYWAIKHNISPYPMHKHHLVIIFLRDKHLSSENNITEISPKAWEELGALIQWAVSEQKIAGGGVVLRFGLRKYNASTLTHVHLQIQGVDPAILKTSEVARAVICKGPQGTIEDALAVSKL